MFQMSPLQREIDLGREIINSLTVSEANAHVALMRFAGRGKERVLFNFK